MLAHIAPPFCLIEDDEEGSDGLVLPRSTMRSPNQSSISVCNHATRRFPIRIGFGKSPAAIVRHIVAPEMGICFRTARLESRCLDVTGLLCIDRSYLRAAGYFWPLMMRSSSLKMLLRYFQRQG
jgi:hypothetical protein